ncbi:MAG: hypothetical protein NZ605_09845 [Acidimicrobiales bacterium]|nr:hypothetical protein [Acidimicrobiales bacterium]
MASWTFHAGTTTLPNGDVFLDLPPWSKGFLSIIIGDEAPDDRVPLTLTKCPGYVNLLSLRQARLCSNTEGTEVTQEESFFGVVASKQIGKKTVHMVDARDEEPHEMSFTVPAEDDSQEFTIRCLSPRSRKADHSTLTIILDYATVDFVVKYIRSKGLSDLTSARKWSRRSVEEKTESGYRFYGYDTKHQKKRGRPSGSTKPPTSPRSEVEDVDDTLPSEFE